MLGKPPTRKAQTEKVRSSGTKQATAASRPSWSATMVLSVRFKKEDVEYLSQAAAAENIRTGTLIRELIETWVVEQRSSGGA